MHSNPPPTHTQTNKQTNKQDPDHENVVRVPNVAAAAKELQQVEELAVDVAAHGHGTAHGLHVGLLDEQQLHHLAHLFQLQLTQQFAVAQVLNPLVEAATATAAAAARGLELLQRHVVHARHVSVSLCAAASLSGRQ